MNWLPKDADAVLRNHCCEADVRFTVRSLVVSVLDAEGVKCRCAMPEKSAPPHAARSTTPAAGRLIWTGRLRKNGTVVFDGKTVSSGVLNGQLPGRPVHINVYPADLSSDGLVLYSGDSKYVKGVAESPGAQNGWNRTLYSWDPHHAGGLGVAESPGPRNRWNRLVLRSKNAVISVIVVDWSAAP